MYVRIVGDAGAVVVDLAERVGIGSGLGILHVGRNRELPGSSIGCCRADFLSCAVFQQEVEVPSALLRCAVLKQGFGAGNVQRRGGCHNFLFPAKNQTAVGHDAAAVDVGMVAGDNDLRGIDCLALGGTIRVRIQSEQIFRGRVAARADTDGLLVAASRPVRRAAARHQTGDKGNRGVCTLFFADTEVIRIALAHKNCAI